MGIISSIARFFSISGETIVVIINPFKFPNEDLSSWKREGYCLRYQEYWHERCKDGNITEAERAARVSIMIPFLVETRKVSISGDYSDSEMPAVLAKKLDWDGEKIVFEGNANDKSAVLHHARVVMAMNMASPDIDKISLEVGKARNACLHDESWDGDISNG